MRNLEIFYKIIEATTLLAATGVDALHFSARRERESGMRFRNPRVSMGGCAGVPEYTVTDADEAFVRQLLAKLE